MVSLATFHRYAIDGAMLLLGIALGLAAGQLGVWCINYFAAVLLTFTGAV